MTINSNLEDCFQSVSDGKALVASAITDKGVETASDATFATIADNISNISGGVNLFPLLGHVFEIMMPSMKAGSGGGGVHIFGNTNGLLYNNGSFTAIGTTTTNSTYISTIYSMSTGLITVKAIKECHITVFDESGNKIIDKDCITNESIGDYFYTDKLILLAFPVGIII